MRVALVCPYSLSAPGGVQGQVLGLARSLRAMDHLVMVVGPMDEPHPAAESAGEVVGVGRSVPVPANGSVAPLALTPLAASRSLVALRRFRPDVVHIHEPLAPGPAWAALARPGPKVGTFHRSGSVSGHSWLAPPGHLAARRLTARTAVSNEARSTAQALAGGADDLYEVIGNGVELDRFSGASPAPTRAPTVLFVGRHEPRKGLAVLLDAFEQLTRHSDARLWVAGEGPQTPELRRRHPSSDRVQWLGRVDDVELAARLAGADVFCAPALGGESFGVVLVEAMAARTAVVASDIAGYAAVVGSHGVLVRPGDPRALADALSAALGDAATGRGASSASALDAAAAHAAQWSMAAVAERYLAVYLRAVAPGRRPGGS